MDPRRANDTLISFALSAMLTSALMATAPGPVVSAATGPFSELTNAAGGQEPPQIHEPASIPSKSKLRVSPISPISDEQFQIIVALINGPHANIGDLEPATAAALGMADDSSALHVRSYALQKQDVTYGIMHLNNNKGYVLTWKIGVVVRCFLMDENRALVSGLIVDNDLAPAAMPVKDAETIFPQVLAFWAMIANKHTPVATPPSA